MTAAPSRKPAKKKDLMARIPAGFVRAVLRGHSSLGLAFAALIYLICLSGSIAVFAHEFQRWESAAAPQVTAVTPDAVQAAFEGAIAAGGKGVEHVYITLPTPDFPRLLLHVDAAEDREFLADAAGKLVPGKAFAWTEFITRLHINLHLPRTWGGFLVGLIGVALLSSLISGILAHPRIFRDAFHLRLGGSRRLQEADLHNRLGVWALPFHVIISLTGAFLGLTTIIVGVLGMAMFNGDVNKVYALFIPAPPVDDPRPAPQFQPLLGGEALFCGYYLNELLLHLLPREDAHPVLFARYGSVLQRLAGHADRVAREIDLRCFEKYLLQELGYGLMLDHDADGQPIAADAFYSYRMEQGAVCVPHAEAEEGTLRGKTLRDLAAEDLSDPASRSEAKRMMRRLFNHYLAGKELVSRHVFADLQRF